MPGRVFRRGAFKYLPLILQVALFFVLFAISFKLVYEVYVSSGVFGENRDGLFVNRHIYVNVDSVYTLTAGFLFTLAAILIVTVAPLLCGFAARLLRLDWILKFVDLAWYPGSAIAVALFAGNWMTAQTYYSRNEQQVNLAYTLRLASSEEAELLTHCYKLTNADWLMKVDTELYPKLDILCDALASSQISINHAAKGRLLSRLPDFERMNDVCFSIGYGEKHLLKIAPRNSSTVLFDYFAHGISGSLYCNYINQFVSIAEKLKIVQSDLQRLGRDETYGTQTAAISIPWVLFIFVGASLKFAKALDGVLSKKKQDR